MSAPRWELGALLSEGRAGCGWVERGWRQHPSEVTPFEKERTEQGCEGENCRGWGSKVRGDFGLQWEDLEHPTELFGLFALGTWEPLKRPS